MDGLRVRRDGQEAPVASLEELYRMVADGRLRRGDEVLTARGWVRASELPEIRKRFGADPWDAWSDLDDLDAADADAVVRGFVGDAPAPGFGSRTGGFDVPPAAPGRAPAGEARPRPPAADDDEDAPTPVPVPRLPTPAGDTRTSHPPGVGGTPRAAPPMLPPEADPLPPVRPGPTSAGAPPPVQAAPPRPSPPESVRGPTPGLAVPPPLPPATIAPPPTRSPPVRTSMPPGVLPMERPAGRHPSRPPERASIPPEDGPGELIRFPKRPRPAPDVATLRERPSARGPTPLVRGSWLVLWVGIGLLALGLYWSWVTVNANGRIGMASAPPPDPVEAEAAPPPKAPTEASLTTLERELRAGLLGEVRVIDAEGELTDALLIDLQNLRVPVARVDAPVTAWSGRHKDEPRSAEIRVHLATGDDLVRPIAATALVAGRYKSALRLDLPVLEVIVPGEDGTLLARQLDARAAEELYLSRMPLEKFLEVGLR